MSRSTSPRSAGPVRGIRREQPVRLFHAPSPADGGHRHRRARPGPRGPIEIVDGNDVEAVFAATAAAVERARDGGGPSLIECKTMRMLGHAIHDGAEYVPPELLEEWEARDPVRGSRRTSKLAASTPATLEAIVARVHRGGRRCRRVRRGERVARSRHGRGGGVRAVTAENFGFSGARGGLRGPGADLCRGHLRGPARGDGARSDVLVMGEDIGGSFGGAFKVTKGVRRPVRRSPRRQHPDDGERLRRGGDRDGPDGAATRWSRSSSPTSSRPRSIRSSSSPRPITTAGAEPCRGSSGRPRTGASPRGRSTARIRKRGSCTPPASRWWPRQRPPTPRACCCRPFATTTR